MTIAVLQTLLALLGWLLFYVTLTVIETDVDAEKPLHQLLMRKQSLEAALVLGLPLLCMTVSAVLSWQVKKLGWWFSVMTDFFVAFWAAWALPSDIIERPDFTKYSALHSDFSYHLVTFLLPTVALCLLLSKPMRSYFDISL